MKSTIISVSVTFPKHFDNHNVRMFRMKNRLVSHKNILLKHKILKYNKETSFAQLRSKNYY